MRHGWRIRSLVILSIVLPASVLTGCAAIGPATTACYDATKLVVRTTAEGVKGAYRLGKEGVELAARPIRESRNRNWPEGAKPVASAGDDGTLVADTRDEKPGRGRVSIGDGAPRRPDGNDLQVDLPPLDIDAILAKADGTPRKR